MYLKASVFFSKTSFEATLNYKPPRHMHFSTFEESVFKNSVRQSHVNTVKVMQSPYKFGQALGASGV